MEFEGVPARLRQRYVRPPRARTKILQSRDVPARKTDVGEGRGGAEEETSERGLRPERILEVKIESFRSFSRV